MGAMMIQQITIMPGTEKYGVYQGSPFRLLDLTSSKNQLPSIADAMSMAHTFNNSIRASILVISDYSYSMMVFDSGAIIAFLSGILAIREKIKKIF
jgi:hypothetical protein